MKSPITLLGVGALGVTLVTSGCATKKFVRQQDATVQARVDEVEKKQTEALGSLENKMNQSVSRVEERAMTAENKANDAARAAQGAQSTADQATQMARTANDLAQQSQTKLQELSTQFQNMDNYRMVSEDEVLFRFDSANLTKEAKQKLDQFAQNASGNNRYVIEVEGFTDRSGPADYNLALSRRRADAVVRYLVDKQIPLRRIHMIGLGETTPSMAQVTGQSQVQNTADQSTTGRTGPMKAKDMRRVVIRTWAPEGTMSASTGAQTSTPRQPQTPTTPGP